MKKLFSLFLLLVLSMGGMGCENSTDPDQESRTPPQFEAPKSVLNSVGAKFGAYELMTFVDWKEGLGWDRTPEHREGTQIRVTPWGKVVMLVHNKGSLVELFSWVELDTETGSFSSGLLPIDPTDFLRVEDFALDRQGALWWIEAHGDGQVEADYLCKRSIANGREVVLNQPLESLMDSYSDYKALFQELFVGPENELYVNCFWSSYKPADNPAYIFQVDGKEMRLVPGSYIRQDNAGCLDNSGNYHDIWPNPKKDQEVWQITDLKTGKREERKLHQSHPRMESIHWADPEKGLIMESDATYIRIDKEGKEIKNWEMPRSFVPVKGGLYVDGEIEEDESSGTWTKNVYFYSAKSNPDTLTFTFHSESIGKPYQCHLREQNEKREFTFELVVGFTDPTLFVRFDAEGKLITSGGAEGVPIQRYHCAYNREGKIWDSQGRAYFSVMTPEGIEIWRYDGF